MMDVLQHTNEVVTMAEAAETVEITETAPNPASTCSMSSFQGAKRGGSKGIFPIMNRKVKQAEKYGEQ